MIYDAWEKGRSIDSISLETGIPRSTVGYYVRKFNRAARKGEPITFREVKKRDEKEAADAAALKTSTLVTILQFMKEKKVDELIKFLTIMKLWKEVKSEFAASAEEAEAVAKNFIYALQQAMLYHELAKK